MVGKRSGEEGEASIERERGMKDLNRNSLPLHPLILLSYKLKTIMKNNSAGFRDEETNPKI